MSDNTLDQFTGYIESLCTKHVDILHTEEDPRFIELNSEKQMARSKSQLYPLVTLDKLTISYTGDEDATRKNRMVEMLFLELISDPNDDVAISDAKNKMESVAEDFIRKMKIDKKNRAVYPFLKTLKVSDMTIDYAENEDKGLYGVLLSFSFELPFIMQLADGRFND